MDAVLHRLSEDSDEYNVCQLALAALNQVPVPFFAIKNT